MKWEYSTLRFFIVNLRAGQNVLKAWKYARIASTAIRAHFLLGSARIASAEVTMTPAPVYKPGPGVPRKPYKKRVRMTREDLMIEYHPRMMIRSDLYPEDVQ